MSGGWGHGEDEGRRGGEGATKEREYAKVNFCIFPPKTQSMHYFLKICIPVILDEGVKSEIIIIIIQSKFLTSRAATSCQARYFRT